MSTLTLRFWGAAGEVTGSSHICETAQGMFLLDCGMEQGHFRDAYAHNSKFPYDPHSVRAVILSHAHLDHSGDLPTLAHQGFTGPVYSTGATLDLCAAMLMDSARIQESDTKFLNKQSHDNRNGSSNVQAPQNPPQLPPLPPLYTVVDVNKLMPLFREVKYGQQQQVIPGASFVFHNAGHILGSATTLVTFTGGAQPLRLLYTGDLGRKDVPILKDPDPAPAADYLIIESTYGDREHRPVEDAKERLRKAIADTVAKGGHVIIPAFAVGRTQHVVLLLHELFAEGKLPQIPIYVDSPLALNVTDVYRKHADEYDCEASQFTKDGGDALGFQNLTYIRTVDESKALNTKTGPFVVIAGSGMAEGGRVLHHLRNGIEDPRNLIIITGYQAANTLGRKLVDHQPQVRILGKMFHLNAGVLILNNLSGHADQSELIEWVRPIAAGLKRVFLVHGEQGAREALAAKMQSELKLTVVSPNPGDKFDLD
jgi:metallo-beta-lactamase family protein